MGGLSRTAGGALLLAAALAPHASAQEILHAPDAIRACICREQTVAALAAALRQARATYDARQQELQSLGQELDAARQRLDAASLAEREAFAHLLDERDAASGHFAGDEVPRYNGLVRRYDATVAVFNRECAGKAYDPEILPQVRASLACPPTALRTEP
jgi:hypothetical protein